MRTYAKWSDFRNLDREQAVAAAQELLPKWIVVLLVAAIAWQLARIAWMLVPADAVGDPVTSRPAGAAAAAAAPGGADVQSIAAAHLFGKADPAAAAPPPPSQELHEDLAETRLNLVLKGTIAADGRDGSLAIIAAQGRDEKVYAVNDTVVTGTTLHAVYPDRVILNTGGALEALKLPKEFPQGGPTTARRISVPEASEAPDPTPSIQQVVARNVTKLADVIRPTPYFVGGEQQGFRVYPGRDRKQFAALGLRPGDLIKSVNGASLADPQQAMEIFQSLGDADQVTVTVERNGQQQVLTLSTSQLTLGDEQ